jgi:CBS domain-containing protein
MNVEQIMTPSPATCGMTDNLAQVVERMWDANCGIVPVVDDTGRVLAVITDRDICVAAATRGLAPGDIRAEEMQRKPVVSCRPDDNVKDALRLMQNTACAGCPSRRTKAYCTASSRSMTSPSPLVRGTR